MIRNFAIGWTLVVGVSLALNIMMEQSQCLAFARNDARANYEKDLLYRRWAAQHGGVYVPATPKTPPNPFLKVANRDVVTKEGMALTLLNPAYMTREVYELEAEKDGIRSHITSLKPIRPANAPDAWEEEALRGFERGVPEAMDRTTINGADVLRLMWPMITETACLKCHGDQGYQVGDIRGGISVAVPLAPFQQILRRRIVTATVAHLLLGGLGLAGLWLGRRQLDAFWRARRSVELTLSESERQFRSLFENMHSSFLLLEVICDRAGNPVDHRLLQANAEFETQTGLRRSEEIGRTSADLSFQWPQAVARRYYDIALNGGTLHIERFNESLNRHYDVRAFSPRKGQWAMLANDITERKRTEAAAAQAREHYQSLLETASDGIHILDRDGNLIEASPSFYRMLGYAPEEKPRLHVADWDLQWSAAELKARIADLVRQPAIFETRHRCRDGQIIAVEINARGIEFGGQLHLYASSRDITERKRAAEALQKSEERFTLSMEATNDGLWDWDIKTDTCYFSPGYFRMLGYAPGEFAMEAKTWQTLMHPDDRESTLRVNLDCIEGRSEHFAVEFRLRAKSGEWRWILGRGKCIARDDQGRALRLVGTHMDITERKQSEAALESSLREKVALLNEVHHRVKNNLQVITSLLRLETGRSEHPTAKSVLKDMQGRVLSMALLHEGLYRSGMFAAVDLGTYVKQIAAQAFRASDGRPGSVQLQLDLAAVQVEMDQALPCGLLVNELVSNCLKHGFPGDRTGEVRIELQLLDGGPQLRLRVSDTGVGLPADFESKRGRSLGLQLVSDLAGQIDGRLEISPGPGAVFEVTFTPKHSKPKPPVPSSL